MNRKETNLNGVREIAKTLLRTEIHRTDYSPIVVQHPFTSSGIVMLMSNGESKCVDITDDDKVLHEWHQSLCHQIDSAKSAFEIYMMTNKPYGMTFLNFAALHLSNKDFSEILADAWTRSENPNNDPNLPQSKLLSMFKRADADYLMTEKERNELETLEQTVTIYRGVTSFNAKNVKALSWTLDKNVAEWFAGRFDEDGTVYQAQIDKSHIYAFFDSRNESEVIVDPKYLMDITKYEEPKSGFIQTL